MQFITVTARNGNVFYFVIDKGAQSENVYFLNTVDESDLEALVEQSDKKPTATAKPTTDDTEKDLTETDTKDNSDTKAEKSVGAKTAEKQFRLVYHSCTCGGCRSWRLLLQSNSAEKET